MLGRDQRALIIPDEQGVKRIIALQSFEIFYSSRAEVGGACSTRVERFFTSWSFKVPLRVLHGDGLLLGNYGTCDQLQVNRNITTSIT